MAAELDTTVFVFVLPKAEAQNVVRVAQAKLQAFSAGIKGNHPLWQFKNDGVLSCAHEDAKCAETTIYAEATYKLIAIAMRSLPSDTRCFWRWGYDYGDAKELAVTREEIHKVFPGQKKIMSFNAKDQPIITALLLAKLDYIYVRLSSATE